MDQATEDRLVERIERIVKARTESEAKALAIAFHERFNQIDQRLEKIEKRLNAIESFQAAQQKFA